MLPTDTKLLLETLRAIDRACVDYDGDLETGLLCFGLLEEANRQLADVRQALAGRLAPRMLGKRQTVMGAGTFERHVKRAGAPRCMDDAGLWRAVLDTRIVDEATGEVLPQHEVILRVYGAESKETGEVRLKGASVTKLEAVGLDPAMFFEKAERVGWTLQVIG